MFAGVDNQLILNRLQDMRKGQLRFRRISPIPSAPLAYTAAPVNMFMLRYPNYLELWKLGATESQMCKSLDPKFTKFTFILNGM